MAVVVKNQRGRDSRDQQPFLPAAFDKALKLHGPAQPIALPPKAPRTLSQDPPWIPCGKGCPNSHSAALI